MLSLCERVRIFWHTRPFHSDGLYVTRNGVYCRCGKKLNDD